jgi:phospholipid/cholesterol/gamma-HCH transport system substrate-binding protein
MLMRARLPSRTVVRTRLSGLVFLVVLALLLGLSVATYNKTFVHVVHVTLKADHVGNQLDAPADVKLRGIIVGEVRHVSSDGQGATVDLALTPSTVGLIPSNVEARLLPKTLFGEKFVDLVIPDQPSGRPIRAGDVIPQDRSSTAIEIETVLDDVLPLLQTVKPAQLSGTLNAFATALEGRGAQLGDNAALARRYFERLNPQLPAIQDDLVKLAAVTDIYADAAPDLVATLRNFAVTNATIAEKAKTYAAFLSGTTSFANTTRDVLSENEDRLVRLAAVSRPTLQVLAKYAPEYPCLLKGLTESNQFIGDAFANGELHITLEVVRPRSKYVPGVDDPAWGERSGPNCRHLPRPPYSQANPDPSVHLNDGTSGGPSGDQIPGFLLDSGNAGTADEQALMDPLLSPVMSVPPDQVPDIATLLFGPMARGTVVSQS